MKDDHELSQNRKGTTAEAGRLERDPQLNKQMNTLMQRIQRLRRHSAADQELSYEELRRLYESQANRDVLQLQQQARQQRIARLIAQADLSPDWTFERMDHQDPALEYAIQTAHSFISGFEHWAAHGGSCVLIYGGYGTGKSTLFKLILGEEQPDSGEIATPKNYKIGALKQYFDFTEKTLIDETALALSEDDKYNIYKAEKILFGLGFSEDDLQKLYKQVLKADHFIQDDFGEEIVIFNKNGSKSFEDFIKKIDEYLGDELGSFI